MALWNDNAEELVKMMKDNIVSKDFFRTEYMCDWSSAPADGNVTVSFDIEAQGPLIHPHPEDEVEQVFAAMDVATRGYINDRIVAADPLPWHYEFTNTADTYTPTVSLCGSDHIMRIHDDDGNMLINISKSGAVEYGEGYIEGVSESYAAQKFWHAIATAFPEMFTRTVDWQHVDISVVKEEKPEDAYDRAMRIIE